MLRCGTQRTTPLPRQKTDVYNPNENNTPAGPVHGRLSRLPATALHHIGLHDTNLLVDGAEKNKHLVLSAAGASCGIHRSLHRLNGGRYRSFGAHPTDIAARPCLFCASLSTRLVLWRSPSSAVPLPWPEPAAIPCATMFFAATPL